MYYILVVSNLNLILSIWNHIWLYKIKEWETNSKRLKSGQEASLIISQRRNLRFNWFHFCSFCCYCGFECILAEWEWEKVFEFVKKKRFHIKKSVFWIWKWVTHIIIIFIFIITIIKEKNCFIFIYNLLATIAHFTSYNILIYIYLKSF